MANQPAGETRDEHLQRMLDALGTDEDGNQIMSGYFEIKPFKGMPSYYIQPLTRWQRFTRWLRAWRQERGQL